MDGIYQKGYLKSQQGEISTYNTKNDVEQVEETYKVLDGLNDLNEYIKDEIDVYLSQYKELIESDKEDAINDDYHSCGKNIL